MSVVPGPRPEKISFFNSKLAPWTANLAALGLVSADMTGLTSATEDAEEARAAFIAAQAAAKAATLNYYNKVRVMASLGADCIGKIRVKANGSADPDAVYVLAQLPPRATPAPVGPPGTPSDYKVELRQDGALVLGWKCINPKNSQGTTYTIRRKLGGVGGAAGEFTQLGITGEKEIIDATVPAGTAQVIYEITAVRSTAIGAPAFFTVSLGVGGGGEMTAMVADGGGGAGGAGGAPKLAA